MGWNEDYKPDLIKAGFSESDVQNIAYGVAQNMQKSGATPDQFSKVFGAPATPDPGHLTEMFDQQFKRNMPMVDAEKEPQDQNTVWNAVKGGLQSSVIGLGVRHQAPDTGLEQPSLFSEGAPLYKRVIQGATTLAADAPVMAAGALTTPLAPMAGAFGLPAAMRAAMMKSYAQGGVHSFSDFMNVAQDAAVQGGKQAIVGAATGAAGAIAGTAAKVSAASGIGATAVENALTPLATEFTAMTATGAALDGKMPEPKDFLDNAVILAATHGLGLTPKLRNVFSDTGIQPGDITSKAMNDPALKQEMLSHTDDTPLSLKGASEPNIQSDFVVKDSKLIRGDSPEAQEEMKFESVKGDDFIRDNEARFTPEKRLEAARLHDPAAFIAMEKRSNELKEAQSTIEMNESQKASHTENAKAYAELQDIRSKLNDPELTQEQFHNLSDRERELSQNENEIKASSDRIDSLNRSSEYLRERISRIQNGGPEMKARLARAWLEGQNTLESNLKDRMMNKQITEPGFMGSKPAEHTYSSDFTSPDMHTPQLTPEAKQDMTTKESIGLLLGNEGREYTNDDMMEQIFKGHEELAEKIAPEVIQKTFDPETGKKTLQIGQNKKAPEPTRTLPEIVNGLITDYANNMLPMEQKQRLAEERLGSKLPLSSKPADLAVSSRASQQTTGLWLGMEDKRLPFTDISVKKGEKENSGFGVFDYHTGEKVTDSLSKILSGTPRNRLDDLRQFLIYKHAIDLNSLGELTGVDDSEARSFVAKYEGEFGDTQKKLVGWNNAILKYASDAGMLSKDTVSNLESKYPNYIPTNRLTEEMTSKSGFKGQDVIYSRKGSELPFLDPIAAMAKKAMNVPRLVEENDAKNAVLKLNEALDGDLLHDTKRAESPGLDSEDFKDQSLNEAAVYSRPVDESKTELTDEQVGFYKDGQYNVMRFKDPALAETMKFKGFDNGFIKAFGYFYAPLRLATKATLTGASTSLGFLVNHVERQTVMAGLLSGRWYDSTVGAVQMLGHAFGKNSPEYLEAQKAGVFKGSIDSLDQFMQSSSYVMRDKEGTVSTALNILKTPWEVTHAGIKIVTDAQKLAIFKSLKDQKPDATFADLKEMGDETRKSFVDGLKVGANAQGLNMITAFQHYETQGLLRYGQAWLDDPAKMAARSAMMGAASLMLWYNTKDSDEYNNLPNADKNNYWHANIPGLGLIRVGAKPWEAGQVFGSLPQRLADVVYHKNPEALAGFEEELARMIPISLPTGFTDAAALANFDTHNLRSVIPQNLMKYAPEDRRTPYTSDVASLISKGLSNLSSIGNFGQKYNPIGATLNATIGAAARATNLDSPVMVDHMLQLWFGQNGRMAIQAADKALESSGLQEPKNLPVWNETADVPFLGSFVTRHDNFNSQPLKDFHDRFMKLEEVHNSLKLRQDQDDEDGGNRAYQYEAEHPELQDYEEMKQDKKMIDEKNHMVRKIISMPENVMSPSDKQQQIPDLYKEMILTAKTRLDELNQRSETKQVGAQ